MSRERISVHFQAKFAEKMRNHNMCSEDPPSSDLLVEAPNEDYNIGIQGSVSDATAQTIGTHTSDVLSESEAASMFSRMSKSRRRTTILYTESNTGIHQEGICNFPKRNIELLHTTRKRYNLKQFSDVHALKTIENFLVNDQGTLIFNERHQDIDDILDVLICEILKKVSAGSALNLKTTSVAVQPPHILKTKSQIIRNSLFTVQDAEDMELVLNQDKNRNLDTKQSVTNSSNDIHLLNETIQACAVNPNGGHAYQQTWMIVLGKTDLLQEQKVGISKLKTNLNLGKHVREVRFVIIVLMPKERKDSILASGFETAKTFATLFSDIKFHQMMLECRTEGEMKETLNQVYQEKKQLVDEEKKRNTIFSINKGGRGNKIGDILSNLASMGPAGSNPASPREPGRESVRVTEDEMANVQGRASMVKKVLSNDNLAQYYDDQWYEIGKSIGKDIKKLKNYASDWTDAFHFKNLPAILTSTLFMWLACLLPTVGFGNANYITTGGFLTIEKGIFAQSVGGLIFALLSNQPLIILLTTAPICVYVHIIKNISIEFDLNFDQLYVYTGMWNAFFLAVYALTNLSKYMKFSTRYTEDIFSLFTAIAFVMEAWRHLNYSWQNEYSTDIDGLEHRLGGTNGTDTANYEDFDENENTRDKFLLYVVLVLVTSGMSKAMFELKNSPYFTIHIREAFADFAMPVAVVVVTFLNWFLFSEVNMKQINLPSNSTLVELYDFGKHPLTWTVFGASFIIGFCLSLLFYMDQGFAAAIVNSEENKLSKKAGYHYDMLLVSIINFILTIFGLPWIHGAIPHSPLHVRALATVEEHTEDGHIYDEIVSVCEQRVSAFASHLLILGSFLGIGILSFVPLPVLDGVFIFIAIQSLYGNQLIERLLLLVRDKAAYPPYHYLRKVPTDTVHIFTLVQLIKLIFLVIIAFWTTPVVELIFPVIVLLYIPIRMYIMPHLFDHYHLEYLDRHGGESILSNSYSFV